MKKYEMLLLLKSDMEEEAREAELNKYREIVTSEGGAVESTDKWGVKKTAYPINFQTDAFYVLIKFSSEADTIKELDRVAGLSSVVLRRMITKAE